jgi:hypothetical protein
MQNLPRLAFGIPTLQGTKDGPPANYQISSPSGKTPNPDIRILKEAKAEYAKLL